MARVGKEEKKVGIKERNKYCKEAFAKLRTRSSGDTARFVWHSGGISAMSDERGMGFSAERGTYIRPNHKGPPILVIHNNKHSRRDIRGEGGSF